jgi:hypothetical protein
LEDPLLGHLFRSLLLLPWMVRAAAAQPTAPTSVAVPADPAAQAGPASAIDEARVREVVDREVARILNERAVKQAAEQAAREAAAPESRPSVQGNLRGASGFVDVRLAFTLTNENLFASPGETTPSVPGWRFGRPNSLGTLFFDNYDTRFSGYETLSHAVLYRNYRKGHLEVESALVLRIDEISERQIDLSDAGSYLLTSWWKDPKHDDPRRVSFTVFPVSSDRFRLGYSYRLSWGGNEEYRRSRSAVPGVKLQFDGGSYYAFAGAKSAVLVNPSTGNEESVFAALGGAGIDLTRNLRLEANGGYFDRGNNEQVDVNRKPVRLYGASLQIAFHDGIPVQSSIDYKLYKNDGERIGQLFKRQSYPGGLSWLAMSEGTVLGQSLKDPERDGARTTQYGAAADLNIRMLVHRYRIRWDAQFRDLAYILHSEPGAPAYSDFPEASTAASNWFAAAGIDRNWDDRLTIGLVVGVERPATLTTAIAVPADPGATQESTSVIRDNGQETSITVLPAGESVRKQVAVKLSGQLDFGDIYAALVDIYYSRDRNQTRLVRVGPDDAPDSQFGEFNQLGVNVTLQARF